MQNLPPAKETIRAAHGLTIEHDAGMWRLYNGARRPEQPDEEIALLDASAGQILCAPAFAKARQLPDSAIDPTDITRVVVGWAPESRNWHLGLLLATDADNGPQPRWCGLASWPTGPVSDHEQAAKTAGQSLARVIDRPFHMIPAQPAPPPVADTVTPREVSEPVQVAQPAVEAPEEPPVSPAEPLATAAQAEADRYDVMPEPTVFKAQPAQQPAATPVPDVERVPVKAPPFYFERWAMQRIPSGYVWKRRARWVWGTLGRITGYTVLGVLYLVLSIGTQTSGFAAVEPTWLPWMGLAVAVLVAVLALRQLWLLWTVTDTIIDTAKGEVRAQRRWTRLVRWRLDFNAVAYVLLSQPPAQTQGRQRHGENTPIMQDVWLHLSDGVNFYRIAELREVEGQSQQWEIAQQRQKTAGRRRLRLTYYDTPAHHAARVISEAIGAELWQDIR